jgi:hypothetical protein
MVAMTGAGSLRRRPTRLVAGVLAVVAGGFVTSSAVTWATAAYGDLRRQRWDTAATTSIQLDGLAGALCTIDSVPCTTVSVRPADDVAHAMKRAAAMLKAQADDIRVVVRERQPRWLSRGAIQTALEKRPYGVYFIASGWPCRSAYAAEVHPQPGVVQHRHAISIGDVWLPCRIIWSGMVANSLIYASVLGCCTLAGKGLWRIAISKARRAKGRCPSCGYEQVGVQTVCPECGRVRS